MIFMCIAIYKALKQEFDRLERVCAQRCHDDAANEEGKQNRQQRHQKRRRL